MGLVFLGVAATVTSTLLAIACWTWLWASIEEELRKPLVDIDESAANLATAEEVATGGALSEEIEAQSC